MNECLLVFREGRYHELPVKELFFLTGNFLPGSEDSRYACRRQGDTLQIGEQSLRPYTPLPVDGAVLEWFGAENRVFPFPKSGHIWCGDHPACHIRLPEGTALSIILEPATLHIEQGTAYLNGRLLEEPQVALSPGDCVYLGGLRVYIRERDIVVNGNPAAYTAKLYDTGELEQPFADFPLYKRSPRIIKRLPDESVSLTNPPAKPEKQKGQLLKLILPPLVMLSMTIAISILIPRGLYALIGIASTFVSMVMSVTNYINDRKDAKKAEADRQKQYGEYLLRQRKALDRLRRAQREALTFHYPPISRIERMVKAWSSRLYERSANDDDFLTVTIGDSTHPASYQIARSSEEIRGEEDNLLTEMREIADEFSHLDSLPTTIDLKRAHLGLVGEKRHVQEQLALLVAQISFFQSYHDVEIICLFDHKHRDRFHWMRWYPHCRIKAINVTGMVDGENVRDQVLGNLAQVLKERKLKQDEQKKEARYLPHYIFIVDEPKLLINHSIMEYLQSTPSSLGVDSALGFSLIYTTDMLASLPENIKTVVQIGDGDNAVLVMNDGRLTHSAVRLQRTGGIGLEGMARSLAALTHVQGISTQIPDSITFFDMYGIRQPEELGVTGRWQRSSSHKSLAVPLGVRAKDDYVQLNLHEKAHGPHGLVAGTTGSGKSEIIQSYILSLAVNFHPYEVGFLLIDYKGGGMAGLFKDLPHLLGMITNLDGGESMRAMASIKSELSRRQRVFSEHGVNHINQYNKLFKTGEATLPMPHLFLISDEFAELKKEQPDFMSELVSAARIGRSLGIHLILATQKPTGVVDDQIWSNSRFKLALKVQDASDSNEVLKTPDAANITQPGRAYLQVGNNEIYELFQSAWSGASYSRSQEKTGYDDRVYLVNKLGQRQLLGEDLSGGEEAESRLTQLDVIVDHLHATWESLALPQVDRPWHPPLAKSLVSPHIGAVVDVAVFDELNAKVPLGLVDVPEQQRQDEWIYDCTSDGNLAIFGSSGFGKSTTLMTLLMTLAVKNSPALLRFFIIDLGNAALAQTRGLPHTADYISLDDADKLDKLVKLISEEMQSRKSLLAERNALNFSMYNMVAGERLPAIVVAIDNYDVIRELGGDLEDFWTRLTRDGAGIGIYVAATATRAGAFKYVVLNNFKKKIAHTLTDQNDMTALIGRTPYSLGEAPGRAFIKFANVNMMQVYTAAPYEDDVTYARDIGGMIDALREQYSGERAEGIRTLPDKLDYELLLEYAGGSVRGMLPVGLDFEEVEVQGLSLANSIHLILGTSGSGKTNVLRLALRSLTDADTEQILLVDSREMELGDLAGESNIRYCADAEDMAGLLEELRGHVDRRRAAFAEQSLPPRQFYTSLPTVCIVVDDIDNFIELLKASKITGAEALVKDALAVGIVLIGASLSSRMKGFDEISKLLKEATSGLILGLPVAQTVWQVSGLTGYRPRPDSAVFYRKGECVPIKVPLMEKTVQTV